MNNLNRKGDGSRIRGCNILGSNRNNTNYPEECLPEYFV
jgi:hypothetical protein